MDDQQKLYNLRTHSVCKKDTADDESFGVGVIRLHMLKKSTKLSEICGNIMEKNGQG